MYTSSLKTSGDFFNASTPKSNFAAYLKRSLAAEETVIVECLLASVAAIENYLWRDVHIKEIVQWCVPVNDMIKIERHVLKSGTAPVIKYYDSAGVLQTLPTTSYRLEDGYIPYFKIITMPTYQERQDAFKVTYETGYNDYASVPKDELNIIHKLGAYHYECRINEKQVDMSWVERYCIGIRNFRF